MPTLCSRVAARTGASEEEVQAVALEFYAQAFAMAVERGGYVVIPHFATLKCRPKRSGGMKFDVKPRSPEELIAGAEERRRRLAVRKPASSRGHRVAAALSGDGYVPRPIPPPQPRQAAQAKSKGKGGFLSRLLGLGD